MRAIAAVFALNPLLSFGILGQVTNIGFLSDSVVLERGGG